MKAERDEAGLSPQMLHVPVLISNTKGNQGWWKQRSDLVVGLLQSSPGVFLTSVGCFRHIGRGLSCVGYLLSSPSAAFRITRHSFSEYAHKPSGTLSVVLSFKPRGKC